MGLLNTHAKSNCCGLLGQDNVQTGTCVMTSLRKRCVTPLRLRGFTSKIPTIFTLITVRNWDLMYSKLLVLYLFIYWRSPATSTTQRWIGIMEFLNVCCNGSGRKKQWLNLKRSPRIRMNGLRKANRVKQPMFWSRFQMSTYRTRRLYNTRAIRNATSAELLTKQTRNAYVRKVCRLWVQPRLSTFHQLIIVEALSSQPVL
jgi:hypothetical protein